MINNLFTCCKYSNEDNNKDIELLKERNYPQINIYNSQIKIPTLINSMPVQLKLVLTSKSNSPLLDGRKLYNDKSSNHIYNIINSNKHNISISYLKNNEPKKNKKNKSLSLIKLNHSIISTLLNNSNLKNFSSEIKDINNRKKLIFSGELFFWKKIYLTPNGIDNNYLKRKERSTYFGIKNLYDFNGNPYNDYLINFKNNSSAQNNINENIETNNTLKKCVDEENSTRVFKVMYDKENDEYQLIYLNHSILLYYQIQNKLILEKKKKYYIILDQVFLNILIKEKKNKQYKVCIKVDNKNESKKYFFDKEDTPIKIGRIDCNINVDLKSISKFHCYIDYSTDKDYFFFQDNYSKNGSLLLVKEDDAIPIKGKMKFKLDTSFFQIEEEI